MPRRSVDLILLRGKKKAKVLTTKEFKKLLFEVSLSRNPERNALIVRMLFDMAMRVSEVARIKVEDMLWPNGKWRDEVLLQAKICKGGKAGIVFTFSPKLREAGNKYFDMRISKKQWMGEPERYRGLHPKSPVILSDRGAAYSLKRKLYVNAEGEEKVYRAADTLQNAVDKWFHGSGIKGASTHSGRRSYADRLAKDGMSIDRIAALLRHSDDRFHNVTYEYLDPDLNLLIKATHELFDI